MFTTRAGFRLGRSFKLGRVTRCGYATSPYSTPAPHATRLTEADIEEARQYCAGLISKFDSPSYTLQTFVPYFARDAYLSIRALNIELARIPDLISNHSVGALRMQFWRDNITRTFKHTPPKEPVAILLHHALESLESRHPDISTKVMKGWFMKVISAREQYMDNRPYTSMDALETYAESTYSTLMYLTLGAIPVHSMEADHVASHIGKATGITAVLRGLPMIAFPGPPNHHSSKSVFGSGSGTQQGAVMLPLDIMAEAGVKEEDIFRHGADAPGLKDAIFTVATRANDHLITAREMLKSLRAGREADHAFEHEGEDGHRYPKIKEISVEDDIERAFGVLMQAIPTRLWLEELEKHDFDVFKPELRARDWRLPFKSYWAFTRRAI